MVKKHDGTWRMCVDFKDLNNACPKDCYPLPEIDWKVESLCGYSFKCFLDAYKGYHQIKMAKEDEEKTAFITSQGIFCYSKMPFGLKNAGSTYQRLVDKAFQRQIGRNLEVNGSYIAKESGMVQYLNKVKTLAKSFKEFSIKQIPRSENKKADALSKIASTSFTHLNKQVALWEELKEKSIHEKEILTWWKKKVNMMTPICEYKTKEILPDDTRRPKRSRGKRVKYAMINGICTQNSVLGPWLRCCLDTPRKLCPMRVHDGVMQHAFGPRSVVAQGDPNRYYWLTLHIGCQKIDKGMQDCQVAPPVQEIRSRS
ncbi:reverse transcriptase domain-containing protein [Tanacetum coccineum]